jgi:hypothetical protein
MRVWIAAIGHHLPEERFQDRSFSPQFGRADLNARFIADDAR